MRHALHTATGVLATLAATIAVGGCGIGDPYTRATGPTRPTHAPPPAGGQAAQQNPGEPPAPPPPSAQSQAPNSPSATPQQAIERFALVYVNWTWRTLPAHLRELAAMSVGAARLAERQAAATASRDGEITATHVYNRGQIVSIARSRTRSGEWVIVTREQTGGNAQYDGLQPSWLRDPRPARAPPDRLRDFAMAATELNTRVPTRLVHGAGDDGSHGIDLWTICLCWVALGAATALGATLAMVAPAFAPPTPPHPTLHPSAGELASILISNLRVLAAPFILVAARFERTRAGRLAGDTIVAAILAGNGIAVGLALGRWHSALIAFVPQLPVEYLAAATSAAAWIDARRHRTGTALRSAAATIALTAAAAAIEVLLTPHAR